MEKINEQKLYDCIANLMGIIDTPIGRRQLTDGIIVEAIQEGRDILKQRPIEIAAPWVDFNEGDKVTFIEATDAQVKWGNNGDPREVLDSYTIYEIERVDIHSWHTKLYLKGIEGKFNSVHFEKI